MPIPGPQYGTVYETASGTARVNGSIRFRNAGRAALRLVVLLSLLLAFEPSSDAAAQPGPAADDAVIARVNGQPILLSELRDAALNLQIPLSSLTTEGLGGEGFRTAVTALVEEALLVQSAQREEITINEVDIARQVDLNIQQLIARLDGEEKFRDYLKSVHLDLDSLRRLMIDRQRRLELSTAIVARRVNVSGPEIEEFKRSRTEEGRAYEEVMLAQIFVRCPKAQQDSGAGRDLFQRALGIAREAGKEPERFSALAREHSDDPAGRARGGLVGWVEPNTLRAALRDRIASMRTDEITEPIATDDGYHVLLLLNRHSARDLLFARKFEQERAKLLEILRDRARIEIYPLGGVRSSP